MPATPHFRCIAFRIGTLLLVASKRSILPEPNLSYKLYDSQSQNISQFSE